MEAIEQYFHGVLFIMLHKVAVTFKSLNDTLVCDHSYESYWALLSYHTVYCAIESGPDSQDCGWTSLIEKTILLLSLCYCFPINIIRFFFIVYLFPWYLILGALGSIELNVDYEINWYKYGYWLYLLKYLHETLAGDHSNEKHWAVYFHVPLFIMLYKVVLTLRNLQSY